MFINYIGNHNRISEQKSTAFTLTVNNDFSSVLTIFEKSQITLKATVRQVIKNYSHIYNFL